SVTPEANQKIAIRETLVTKRMAPAVNRSRRQGSRKVAMFFTEVSDPSVPTLAVRVVLDLLHHQETGTDSQCVRGQAAGDQDASTRDKNPPLHFQVPSNGFELTGAGLAPRCNDDRREAGVRCSEGLDDAFTC